MIGRRLISLRARPRLTPAIGLVCFLAGCTGSSDTLYPTGRGHWWQYRMTTTILDENRTQKLVVTNLGELEIERRRYLGQRVQQDHLRLLEVGDSGVFRKAQRNGREDYKTDDPATLIAPPAAPAAFSAVTVDSMLQVIESRTFAREDKLRPRRYQIPLALTLSDTRETVTVPAGTFADCVVMEARGTRFVPADRGNATAEVEVYERSWFAPGVGLVKVDREERSDSVFLKSGQYTQVLEAWR